MTYIARTFSTFALALAIAGLSNTLKANPVESLVRVTFEQVAWASFKVQSTAVAYNVTFHVVADRTDIMWMIHIAKHNHIYSYECYMLHHDVG